MPVRADCVGVGVGIVAIKWGVCARGSQAGNLRCVILHSAKLRRCVSGGGVTFSYMEVNEIWLHDIEGHKNPVGSGSLVGVASIAVFAINQDSGIVKRCLVKPPLGAISAGAKKQIELMCWQMNKTKPTALHCAPAVIVTPASIMVRNPCETHESPSVSTG